ncbi:MAG: arginine--tRNA ligase [Rhodomicrobium sp.]|nr:MAG: arginine--tRNA ligase [Rhodomicrobium sp.]
MDLFDIFEEHVDQIIDGLVAEGVVPEDANRRGVIVELPRDTGHGDLSTNAAMVLAKPSKMNPRALAEQIAGKLGEIDIVASAEVAGPGFINLRLETSFWPRIVKAVLEAGDDYGKSNIGGGAKLNIEYVSANPTGPMHVGHTRGAVFGDALARLLEFTGYDVCREYYINDAGAQVDVLARSAFLRYREALGEDIGEIPEGLYPGDYLVPLGVSLSETHGEALLSMDEAEWLPIVKDAAIDAMMALIREDLAKLNIHHDVFFSEKTLHENNGAAIGAVIESLRSAGHIYRGRLDPPKGTLPEDWEDREQTLFRATDFGDDVDRALEKSDGSYTYFAADIAYHKDKFDRGFAHQIDVLGADHGGYIKRLKAALKAISDGKGELDVRICQLVKLLRDGAEVKMSKRAGTFVTLRDVVEEVGVDPVRFMMLMRKNDATLDFDFARVTEQSKDNPVFYVQYGHARTCSLFRQLEESIPGMDSANLDHATAPLTRLTDEGEIAIMRKLAQYPRVIAGAAAAQEPHRIAFYLYELASDLHSHWARGKVAPHLRIIQEDDWELTQDRFALIAAVGNTLKSGLTILGVSAPREMR